MSTDRELDTLLAGAAVVRDADLPDLPDTFLTALRTGDEEPASVLAARQLADDALRSRRRRRPSHKALVRVGAGVLAIAAAWTAAVVVDRPDRDAPPVAVPSPSRTPTELPIDPAGGLTLTAAEAVTFPYSVDPAPEGLTPYLTRAGGLEMFGTVEPVRYGAEYRSGDDLGFAFSISARDPRVPLPGTYESPPYAADEVDERGTVSVDGRPADFLRATFAEPDCRAVPATPTQTEEPGYICSDRYAELFWQRADGQWIGLRGQGDRYGDERALVAVAESIVDRPQPVQLQFGLSPEGWAVSSYESLAYLSLVDESNPTSLTERISVSLQERWRGYDDPEDVLQGMTGGDPAEQVTVNGLPAALASEPDHFADPAAGRRMWNLSAQFADDGPLFLLQAPDTLTRDDVLAMAEGLSYTP